MSRKDLRALAAEFKQNPPGDPANTTAVDDDSLEAELAARMSAATEPPTDTNQDQTPAPATPPTPKPKKRQTTSRRDPNEQASPMTKATVQLPAVLAERLRESKKGSRRSAADVVVTAYLNQLDAVRTKFAPTEDDQRRLELGLPPLATATQPGTDPSQHRTQVGLYISRRALEELNDAAEELSLSRSELVGELLTHEFAAAAT